MQNSLAGTMMDFPLTTRHILWRMQRLFSRKTIFSRAHDGEFRLTYGEALSRVAKLANALVKLGVGPGDRVATLAWNTHRHLEAYLAVTTMGSVLHTVNVRLHPSEIEYVINHAGDKVVLADVDLVKTLATIAPRLSFTRHVVVMGPRDLVEGGDAKAIVEAGKEVHFYEELISGEEDSFDWPSLREDSAAIMCYSSGTTGRPKGVVYTHRSIILHSLVLGMVDYGGFSERDVVMPVVPMAHINGWDFPFAALMVGANLVMPGPRPSPGVIVELIERERVTITDGVPTVWLGVLDYLEREERVGRRHDLSSLRAILTGGSAPPRALIKAFLEKYGVKVIHAWGMTETQSIASISFIKSYLEPGLDIDGKLDYWERQGLPLPLYEVELVDMATGKPLPWDGKSMGELVIRGPLVTGGYYRDPERSREVVVNGWLRTGDVAVIDGEGYIKVVDRTKDVIKSGGEWISSVELENSLMAHPAVLEATVVGVPHEKWGERPVAVVVLKPEYRGRVKEEDIVSFLQSLGKFPKWWLPDKVIFVDEIPKTSTGKFDKKVVRELVRSGLLGK